MMRCFIIASFAMGAVLQADAQIAFMAPQETLKYSSSGSGPHALPILIRDDSPTALVTQAFSMGMSHDPAIAEVIDIELGDAIVDDIWGNPEFFQADTYTTGWTCWVVYSSHGSWTRTFPTPAQAIIVTYAANPDAPFLDGSEGATTALTWVSTLGSTGSPPVSNVVVVGGASTVPELEEGYLEFEPTTFVRGDMNGDNQIDLSDVFTAQDYAILGGPPPSCLAALDANGDQGIDIADIIFLLGYLFVDGAAPPTPFPDCGPDTQASELTCEAYPCP